MGITPSTISHPLIGYFYRCFMVVASWEGRKVPEAATKPTKEGPLLTDIVFVVNGKPTPPDKHPPAKNLGVASEKALKDTKNMGPLDQWVLTLGARELSFAKSFGEENVPSKSTMHLNPRKGKGGCVASA